MFKNLQAMGEWVIAYRKSLVGLGLCKYNIPITHALDIASKQASSKLISQFNSLGYGISSRMTKNIEELERNTVEKKLFDPTKAKA